MFEFDFEDLGSEGEASYWKMSRAWNWRTDKDFKFKISKNYSNYSCIIIVSLAN